MELTVYLTMDLDQPLRGDASYLRPLAITVPLSFDANMAPLLRCSYLIDMFIRIARSAKALRGFLWHYRLVRHAAAKQLSVRRNRADRQPMDLLRAETSPRSSLFAQWPNWCAVKSPLT